jgi:membrane-bound lytic murein transglycosylase MltF
MDLILLLQLIMQVENAHLDPRAIGTAGERGLLQIHPIAMRHVNEVYGTTYRLADLTDKARCFEVGEKYLQLLMSMYKKETGQDITLFNLVRCWNGGPDGYKRVSTLNYWQKFYRFHNSKVEEVIR